MQRHQAARAVALRVKGKKESIHEFEEFVNQEGFAETLDRAIANPTTSETVQLEGKLRNLVSVVGVRFHGVHQNVTV